MGEPWKTTPPTALVGQRLVTLLDFTGPLAASVIASTLDERPDAVASLLIALERKGYVRLVGARPFALWESTGYWAPDPRGLEP